MVALTGCLWGNQCDLVAVLHGDDSKIKFWHNLWGSDQHLKGSFWFSIALVMDASVVDNVQNVDGSHSIGSGFY